MGGGVSVEDKRNLMESVVKGDGFRVQTILRRLKRSAGSVINSLKDAGGNSLLTLGVQSGDESTVEALLAGKADPSRPSGQSKSPPLIYVANVERELAALGIARCLLDAKANVNCQDTFQQTPLYMCAQRTERGLVQYLVDRGASVQHWNHTFNRSLLMEFFIGGMHPENLALLIDNGAELSDSERDTVLHVAAQAANHQVLELILRRTGAGKPHIEARDAHGLSVLHIAAGAGGEAVRAVGLLLEANADVDTVNTKGETVLQTAIEAGDAPLALFLLRANADPNKPSPSNTSAVLAACRHVSAPLELLEGLLAARADPTRQENVSLATPLHALAEREDGDSDEVLGAMAAVLQAGASPSVRDAGGRLPLHLAYEAAGTGGLGAEGGAGVALLLGWAGLEDVYTRDYRGRLPREAHALPDQILYGDPADLPALHHGWAPPAHSPSRQHSPAPPSRPSASASAAPASPPRPAPAAAPPPAASSAEAAISDYLLSIRLRAEHARQPPDPRPPQPLPPSPAAYPPQHPLAPQPPKLADPSMLQTLGRPRRHTPAASRG